MVSQHADDPVAQVDGETGKHPAYLGIQGGKRLQDECVRRLLLQFGRERHGLVRMDDNRLSADLSAAEGGASATYWSLQVRF